MSKLKKRLTALLLSGMLVIGSVPGRVFAASTDVDPGQTSEIAQEVYDEEDISEAPAAAGETADAEETLVTPADAEESLSEAASAEEAQYFTVILDANGGYFENEWDDAIGDYARQAEVVEKHIPVDGTVASFPVFTDQDGQTMLFAGWSLERNGELITTGDEVYSPVDNCTLYAAWQAVEPENAALGETGEQEVADEVTEQADADQETEGIDAAAGDTVTAEMGAVEEDTAAEANTDPETQNEQDIFPDQQGLYEDEDTQNISKELSDSAVEEEGSQPELNESSQEEEETVREDAANGEVAGGTCGDNLTWTLDEEGTLTISGTGEKYSFIYADASPWYTLRPKIKRGVISNGVTAVGNEAFDGCENLTSVEIANSVTTIGEGAFYKCTSLGEISIPNSVTVIKRNAFYGCGQLSNIEITDSVVKIGSFAFNGTPWLNAMGDLVIFNHILLRYTGSSTSFTIPDGVKMIGADAFYRNQSLQSITIPAGVEEIWEFAFSGCTKLTEVELPEGVTSIEQRAFAGCSGMTKIKLPNSLISIGGFAFSNCSNLSNVSIPKNVKKIDTYAFDSCSSFTDIAIPKGIQTLSWGLFNGCSNLASVRIPKGVTEIKNWTFNDCSLLKDIYYEGSEDEWGKLTIGSLNNDPLSSATIHYNYSFGGNIELEPEISCVAGVEITVSATYKGSGTITSVDVKPDDESAMEIGEVSIGAPVGTGDDAETLISFPLTAKKEGEYNLTLTADDGTEASVLVKVTSIDYELKDGILTLYRWEKSVPDFASPEDAPWYEGRAQITRVIVSEKDGKVSKIDNYAFQNCPSLRSVLLQSNVPEIGDHAFTGDVVTIYQKGALGNGPSTIVNLDGVTGWIVWECEAEHRLMISGTGKMEDMTPETAALAPWAQETVQEVTIGGGITRVGNNTFLSTNDLYIATFSENVKEIGSHIMPETENYDSDDINAKISRINIRFCGNAPGIEENAFYRAKVLAYVPPFDETWTEDRMLDYQGKVSWGKIEWEYEDSDFDVPFGKEDYKKGIKLVISGTGEIPDYYTEFELPWFLRASKIAEIEIQDGVTGIGSNAFYKIPSVSRISIGKDVKRVGARAFSVTGEPGETGNYYGGAQIFFSGNAPDDFAEDAFGEEGAEENGYRTQYPYDIYHLNNNGWNQLQSKAWTNPFLSWVHGEPTRILERSEVWGIDGSIPTEENMEGQFGKASDGYYLSSDDLKKLLRGLNWKEKNAVKKNGNIYRYNLDGNSKKEYEASGGSCRGFSVSEGLLYGNITSPGFITKPLGSFEKNHPSDRTKSFINFYHLQQHLPAVQKYMADFQSMNQSDQLSELETLVRQAEASHEMVEISFRVSGEASDNVGHSLMGYALEEGLFHVPFDGNDHVFDHRILTYDPHSYNHALRTYVSDEIAGFNYHTSAFYYSTDPALETYGMWTIPYRYMHHSVSQTNGIETDNPLNNAKLESVASGATYLNAIDYETGTNNFKNGLSYETMTTTEQNFDVVAEDGTVYSVRDGELRGNSSAVVLSTLNGAVESNEITVVFRTQINSCTVRTDTGGGFSFYSEYNDALSFAAIESEGEILFDRQGGVSVTTNNPGRAVVEVTKDNIKNANDDSLFPNHTQRIELTNIQEASVLFDEDGLVVSSDRSTAINCISEDAATEEKVEVAHNISQEPLLIRSFDTDINNLVIMEDTDNDGVFDTVIASSNYVAFGDLTDTVSWHFDKDGELTVFGKGAIPNSSSPEWQDYKDDIQKIVLRDGITSVGSDAFKDCKSCRSVSIPESVYSIRDRAFSGCTALEELDWIKAPRPTRIGDEVFLDCDSLCSVAIPEGVYALGDYAFARCDQLKSVIIPDTVLFIGDYAFTENDSLENVQMGTKAWWKAVLVGIDGVGGGVTYPEGLFSNCPSLKTVTIPEGHKKVFTSEFENCESLQSITLPKTLERIKDNAFKKCGNLATVIYNGTREEWKALNIDNGNIALERCRVECSDGPLMLVTALSATLPSSAFAYTGKAITPEVTLKDGSITLKKGTDYEVSYTDNTNIGTATVTITGKGNYTGTVNKTFTISAASIANATVSGISNKTYTGSALTQNPTVIVGDRTLTKNTDYTVSYANNTNVGTATVTITGKGNYTSKKTATFKINKAGQSITAKAGASRVAVGKTTTVSITGNKGKKSYKSSNIDIATVTSAGKVTAKKVGTVKITATSAATSNYNAVSKTVTIKIVPAATASLTAANQATGIKLTWKKVTGANGYKVYRGSTLIKTITSGSTVTYADAKANTNGTKYNYKVVAEATTGDSTLSKSVAVYRVARPAISSVTNSAASKMTVKWGKNAKASGYHIQYSTDKTFKSGVRSVSISSASTVSKAIGSLSKGKTYYVRIRTYKTVGSAKYWSIWSAARSVKISK